MSTESIPDMRNTSRPKAYVHRPGFYTPTILSVPGLVFPFQYLGTDMIGRGFGHLFGVDRVLALGPGKIGH